MQFKNFITVIFSSLAIVSSAQIPNYSFEDWTTIDSYSMPVQWDCLNALTETAAMFTCEQGTPGLPGSSFLKLTSKNIPGMGVMPGVAVSGVIDTITYAPISGFAFTDRPESLTGKWQHMIYGGSQGYIDVVLTRWDLTSGERVTVASAHKQLTGMAMSWASFSIPLDYADDNFPDSCIITLRASGNSPSQNDFLYIDNLQFEGTVVSTGVINHNSTLQIFPNPAHDVLYISDASDLDFDDIVVVDAIGNICHVSTSLQGNNKIMLDCSGLTPGIYVAHILSENIKFLVN